MEGFSVQWLVVSTLLSGIVLSSTILSAILLSTILSATLLSTMLLSAILFIFLIIVPTLTLIAAFVVALAIAIVLVFVVTITSLLRHVEDDTCIDELGLKLHQHILTLLGVHTQKRSPANWINVAQDLAPQIIFKIIAVLAVVSALTLVVVKFCGLVKQLLAEASAIAIQAGVSMVAFLVVTVAIVVSWTILRAAVRAGPAFSANVAEAVSAFARNMVASWVIVSVSSIPKICASWNLPSASSTVAPQTKHSL
jgi:hypothetical protein